jgi:hypothetical protein
MARITEDARNNIVFLGWDASKADDPAAIDVEGTGFLLYCGEGGHVGVYLVTAAHVARKLASDPFVMRANDESGLARLDHIDSATWYYHPDPTVDAAMMRYEPSEWHGGAAMQTEGLLTRHKAQAWEIGPGDAVYLIGLFYLHKGRQRNLPVVHAGHIALMPDEKIPIDDGDEEVAAYLVEVQGLKGASGSPVMVRPTLRHYINELNNIVGGVDVDESLAISEGRDYVLGVWTAAWPGKPDAILGTARGLDQSVSVPVGMGLVVPCYKIIQILDRDDLKTERRQAMAKDRAGKNPSR